MYYAAVKTGRKIFLSTRLAMRREEGLCVSMEDGQVLGVNVNMNGFPPSTWLLTNQRIARRHGRYVIDTSKCAHLKME